MKLDILLKEPYAKMCVQNFVNLAATHYSNHRLYREPLQIESDNSMPMHCIKKASVYFELCTGEDF